MPDRRGYEDAAEATSRPAPVTTRYDSALLATIMAAGVLAGAGFGWFTYGISPLKGAAIGALISAIWMSFDLLFALRRLRNLPFGLMLAVRALGLTGAIVLGLSLGIFILGSIDHPRFFSTDAVRGFWTHGRWEIDLAFSFAVGTALTLFSAMRLLTGPGVLLQFLLGRYYRPRVEQRIFLFADLVGSTALAERLGDLGFHALLQQVIADLSDPVARLQGRIDRYIGDALVVTWPLAAGARDARALRCGFALRDRLDRHAADYEARFGTRPAVRIGLHAGPVIAGEVGVSKKEILFLGDTVNTAARVEEACRTLQRPMLVTRELLDAVPLPPGWRAESLGTFLPRGRTKPTELFTVERA